MIDTIAETAASIIQGAKSPVIRYRLLRDVLQCPPANSALRAAKEALPTSPWLQQLVSEQHGDGSWGRFHSQDSGKKQDVPTTEFALERALTLGLSGANPLLQRTAGYITRILLNEQAFPDPAEKNDRIILDEIGTMTKKAETRFLSPLIYLFASRRLLVTYLIWRASTQVARVTT